MDIYWEDEPSGWSMQWMDVTFAVPPKTDIEEIVQSTTYVGTDGEETYILKDVSILDTFTGTVSGGGGVDSLVFGGASQTLDLSAFNGRMSSVEVIDITGSGNNTLKVSLGDILTLGSVDLFYSSGDVQMLIKGNAGDVVILSDLLPNGVDPGDWTNAGVVELEGVTYVSYQHSAMEAELLVQQEVAVNLV